MVVGVGGAFLLDDQADGVGRPLRRMRNAGGQEEHLPLLDRDVAGLAALADAENDVAFELVEQLLGRVDVEIGPLVGPTDDHDHEVLIQDHGVAHRRLQQLAVFVDPALQVEGSRQRHRAPPEREHTTGSAITLSPSPPIGNARLAMSEASTNLPVPSALPAALTDLDRAIERHLDPVLQRVKHLTLEVIEEIGRKHGAPMLGEVRRAVVETVGTVIKTEIPLLVEKLKPAIAAGAEIVRKELVQDVSQLIANTAADVFQKKVPEYSRSIGLRLIDYLMAGTLFVLSAVLLSIGLILGLEWFGVPKYATYLTSGGLAVVLGWVFLRLRARRWGGEPPAASPSNS